MSQKYGINLSADKKVTDWEAIYKKVDFVILRIGWKREKDKKFEDYYAAAKSLGIPIGAYYLGVATDANNSETYAKDCLGWIKGKTFDYPIYYNLSDNGDYNIPEDKANDIALSFMKTIKKGGYRTGLYINSTDAIKLKDKKINESLEYDSAWIYEESSVGKPTNYLNAGFKKYDIWQYKKDSFTTGVDKADENYCYVNFTVSEGIAEKVEESTVSTKVTKYLLSKGERITDTTVRNWIDQYIIYDEDFIKKTNEDLDKIVIGKGAINLEGNYTLEGSENEEGQISENDKEYITFRDLFTPIDAINQTIRYTPNSNEEGDLKKVLIGTENGYHYHKKDNKLWSWTDNPTEQDVVVKDKTFLLFKANQTIENPYIGIKTQSKPLKIIFTTVDAKIYDYPSKQGIEIDVKGEENDKHYYYENIAIKIVPVNSTTCTQEFLDLISFNKTTGSFNHNVVFEWKSDYLKSSYSAWTGSTSVSSPAVCSAFLETTEKTESRPYLLFLNEEYQGLIYLTKEDENTDGGDN